MRKLINLCKKPFLISSIVLTVVAVVALVVVCCLPHGGTYTYSKTEDGHKMEQIVTFKGDKVEMSAKFDGKPEGEAIEMAYKIKDGKIYVAPTAEMVDAIVKAEEGGFKINSFKFTSNMGDEEMVFTCGLNYGLMIASAVVAGLGALLTAFCATILVLDNKGKFNA